MISSPSTAASRRTAETPAMPRSTRRRATAVLELAPSRPVTALEQDAGVDRLRAALRARREAPQYPRPSFRDRLEAWLEEEL